MIFDQRFNIFIYAVLISEARPTFLIITRGEEYEYESVMVSPRLQLPSQDDIDLLDTPIASVPKIVFEPLLSSSASESDEDEELDIAVKRIMQRYRAK